MPCKRYNAIHVAAYKAHLRAQMVARGHLPVTTLASMFSPGQRDIYTKLYTHTHTQTHTNINTYVYCIYLYTYILISKHIQMCIYICIMYLFVGYVGCSNCIFIHGLPKLRADVRCG